MRTPALIVALALLVPASAARAQEEAAARAPAPTETARKRIHIGLNLLPVFVGKVATGPSGHATSSNLDTAYGLGLWASYRLIAGLSVGIAPQILFGLTSNDAAGYNVIDSEKEYDLLARIAYAHTIVPRLDLYAELLPGFSIVTYNKITVGSRPPSAKGFVLGGGLGATFDVTPHVFANASLGYQRGFQKSSGIIRTDLETKLLRIAIGAGVKF